MSSRDIDITSMNNDRQELHVLSLEEFSAIAAKLKDQVSMDDVKLATGIGLQLTDSRMAVQLIATLGFTGKAIVKEVRGKSYVILKGHPGLRTKLTGTRYLASNPKVVDLAIGRKQLNNAMMAGARLSIFFTVPLNVLQYLINEQRTFLRLIGTLAMDLVKIGLTTIVASAAAFVVGTATTVVVGPIIAAIFAGVVTAVGLEYLDTKFGVTNALVEAMEKTKQHAFGELARKAGRFERSLMNHAFSRYGRDW